MSLFPHSTPVRQLVNTVVLSTAVFLISACSQQPLSQKTSAPDEAIVASTNESADIVALKNQLQQSPNNAELHYKLGLAYLVQDEKNTSPRSRGLAIKNFRKVLTLVPGNPATLKLLYNIYYEDIVKGDEKAFANASNIYYQLPSTVQLEMNAPSLGVFLHRYLAQQKSGTENPTELYTALLAAIHEQPASDKAYIQLAKIYREESYFPLALATLKIGAEQITDSGDLYEAIANTYEARAESSGCSYDDPSYLSDAIHYYQQAIPLTSDSAALHYALARLYLDQNQYQLALHESSILIELAPTADNIAFSAQNYSSLGKEQPAQQLLAQAKAQGLSQSDSAFHEIYMNSGEWMKAAEGFTDYLQAKKSISVYDFIKAGIIGEHADRDFSALIEQKELLFNSEWEAALYAYWTDQMSSDQIEQEAINRCERTEFFFYSGYRAYRAGEYAEAKTSFTAALQQNTYRFIERPLARYFLDGINARH